MRTEVATLGRRKTKQSLKRRCEREGLELLKESKKIHFGGSSCQDEQDFG